MASNNDQEAKEFMDKRAPAGFFFVPDWAVNDPENMKKLEELYKFVEEAAEKEKARLEEFKASSAQGKFKVLECTPIRVVGGIIPPTESQINDPENIRKMEELYREIESKADDEAKKYEAEPKVKTDDPQVLEFVRKHAVAGCFQLPDKVANDPENRRKLGEIYKYVDSIRNKKA